MQLKNMAMPKEKMADNCQPCSPAKTLEGPRYPYGLCLHLDEDALKKLGITEMPAVGSKLKIEAVCDVTSVGEFESMEGGSNRNMSLQITDLGIGKKKEEVSAKKFYKEG